MRSRRSVLNSRTENWTLSTKYYGMNPCLRQTCTMPRRSTALDFWYIIFSQAPLLGATRPNSDLALALD